MSDIDPLTEAVTIQRLPDGIGVQTNIPWTVDYANTNARDTSYLGSGPAELALNILNYFVPPESDGRSVGLLREGAASVTALDLHKAFNEERIAGLAIDPGETVEIDADDIRRWIVDHAPGVQFNWDDAPFAAKPSDSGMQMG